MNNRTLITRPSQLKEGDIVDFIWLSTSGERQYNNITVSGAGRKLSFKYVNKDGERCSMVNQHDTNRDIFKYITNVMRHDIISAADGLSTILSDWWGEIIDNSLMISDEIEDQLKQPRKKDRYYTDESMIIINPKIKSGSITFKIKGGTGGMTFKKFASFRKCTKKEIIKFIS